jgi:hypothetical protein
MRPGLQTKEVKTSADTILLSQSWLGLRDKGLTFHHQVMWERRTTGSSNIKTLGNESVNHSSDSRNRDWMGYNLDVQETNKLV